jgi:hypothetical protein
MKRRLALKLHGWAYRLEPQIAVAVRDAIILQLAAEHQASQQAKQQAQSQSLAAHRERAARAAQNN